MYNIQVKGGILKMNCAEGYCGPRNFFSKNEKVDMLKKYKEDLDNESKGVAERIKEIENSD